MRREREGGGGQWRTLYKIGQDEDTGRCLIGLLNNKERK